jgi:DNA polymerase I-like protein with 3'-5' exonuclease and polymerase domains
LTLDGEASGAVRNKGHPFDPRNHLVSFGVYDDDGYLGGIVERDGNPYGDILRKFVDRVARADLLVGFNIKYDLHWMKRYGIPFAGKSIYDCQIGYFLLNAQRAKYPSLDESLFGYGLEQKPAVVRDYWNHGVDTDAIPVQTLLDYMEHDIKSTYAVYCRQVEDIKKAGLTKLMTLHCADLLVLQEMEWNGMKYDVELSLERAAELRKEESELLSQLNDIAGYDWINWESPDQISSILYGGKITKERRVQVGEYKSGQKLGQPRFRVETDIVEFQRLVEPLEGTELKKEGKFATDEPTLSQLKTEGKASLLVERILKLARIQKLIGTYYEGLPKRFDEFGWEDNIIHHSLNQCVAVTGRLSSTKPNLQNNDKTIKDTFITRYD